MANEILGREVPITIDGTLQGVARTKSMTINNEPVNVTADDDDGIQRLLDKPGEKSVEMTVALMFDSEDVDLIDTSLTDSVIVPVELDYGTYTRSGDFFIASVGVAHEYNTAVTVDVTLQSSGEFVKTPVSPP